jgi:hypothetical protein
VTHDHRLVDRGLPVELDVGPADAGDLDLQQRGVVRDVRHRELAQLGRTRRRPDRREHLFCHADSSFLRCPKIAP